MLNVKDHGVMGDGTTDDTVALQAAINLAITNGVEVFIPTGVYLISAAINITSSVLIKGNGKRNTKLVSNSGTNNYFSINTENAVEICNLMLWTNVTRTAGSGIEVTATTHNTGSVFKNLIIANHYIGIKFVRAALWTVDNCYITSSEQIGVYVSNENNGDSGDCNLINNIIDGGAIQGGSAGVYQCSAGGLKMTNNKILGHGYGYHFSPLITGATSDILIANNSIESQVIAGISFTNYAGCGGGVGNINITGNQITCVTPIEFRSNYFAVIAIVGNILTSTGAGASCLFLNGSVGTLISGNTMNGGHPPNYGISIYAPSVETRIGNNFIMNCTTPYYNTGINTIFV